MRAPPCPSTWPTRKSPMSTPSGATVTPDGPQRLQVRTVHVRPFPLAGAMAGLLVRREEEFAPVKNKDGVDSPPPRAKLVLDLHRKWAVAAGHQRKRNCGQARGDFPARLLRRRRHQHRHHPFPTRQPHHPRLLIRHGQARRRLRKAQPGQDAPPETTRPQSGPGLHLRHGAARHARAGHHHPRAAQTDPGIQGGDSARAAAIYGMFGTIFAAMQFFFAPDPRRRSPIASAAVPPYCSPTWASASIISSWPWPLPWPGSSSAASSPASARPASASPAPTSRT